jgi:hypothetical protein
MPANEKCLVTIIGSKRKIVSEPIEVNEALEASP